MAVHSKFIFPKLNENQIIQLGWAQTKENHPKSCYINFPKRKKPNIIRIGIFGCSYTAGAEVDYGFDFPSLLQEKINKSNKKNIEVINFGVNGYGVHQSYLMWEYLGKEYDLDHIIIMPFAFHADRDNSFIFEYNSFGPIHARYILKNNKPKLLPVIGENRIAACKIYNHLFPPWQYTRYDKKPPTFLRFLLPAGRKLKTNPFYYRHSKNKEEILKTYLVLFKKMAHVSKSLIVICPDNSIYNLSKKIPIKNVFFIRSHINTLVNELPDLYRAPISHWSAFGYHTLANEIYALLTGQNKPQYNTIKLALNTNNKDRVSLQLDPLYNYKTVSLNIMQQPIAGFMLLNKKIASFKHSQPLNSKKHKFISLLMFPDEKDLKFLPLPFKLQNGEKVFLSFRLNGKKTKLPIGNINALNSVFGILSLTKDGSDKEAHISWESGRYFPTISAVIYSSGKIEDIAIVTDKNSLLKAKEQGASRYLKDQIMKYIEKKQFFSFEPTILNFCFLRPQSGQFADLDNITKKNGTIDLVLTDKNDRVQRFPIMSYKITPAETADFDKTFINPIK